MTTFNVNSASKNKGRAIISNVPMFDRINSEQKNLMELFDNNVLSFSSPEKSIASVSSFYQNGETIHLNPTGNKELFSFSVEFVVDEDYINYGTFCYWWKAIRAGVSQLDLYKNFTINEINLWYLDNQKRDRFNEKLKNVYLASLSGLNTSYEDEADQMFTASFMAEHLDFNLVNDNIKVIDTVGEFDSN